VQHVDADEEMNRFSFAQMRMTYPSIMNLIFKGYVSLKVKILQFTINTFVTWKNVQSAKYEITDYGGRSPRRLKISVYFFQYTNYERISCKYSVFLNILLDNVLMGLSPVTQVAKQSLQHEHEEI
jgi:hypothetical protein